MKIFEFQQSFGAEVAENMKQSIIKNAVATQHSDMILYKQAMELICEAADLYSAIGDVRMEQDVTAVIENIAEGTVKTDAAIKTKLASLKKYIDYLNFCYANEDVDKQYHKLAIEKIAKTLSCSLNDYSEISSFIDDFSVNYTISPRTLEFISKASDSAENFTKAFLSISAVQIAPKTSDIKKK